MLPSPAAAVWDKAEVEHQQQLVQQQAQLAAQAGPGGPEVQGLVPAPELPEPTPDLKCVAYIHYEQLLPKLADLAAPQVPRHALQCSWRRQSWRHGSTHSLHAAPPQKKATRSRPAHGAVQLPAPPPVPAWQAPPASTQYSSTQPHSSPSSTHPALPAACIARCAPQSLPLRPPPALGSWQAARTVLGRHDYLHVHINFSKLRGGLRLGSCRAALHLEAFDPRGVTLSAAAAADVRVEIYAGEEEADGQLAPRAEAAAAPAVPPPPQQHPTVLLNQLLGMNEAMADFALYDATGRLLIGR
jgi:hypothetical protein